MRSRFACAVTFACAACGRIGFDRADAAADADPRVLVAIEAESGELVAPFEVVADATASRGAYVRDGNSRGAFGNGSAAYSFSLAERHGGVVVWARTLTIDTAADSFFISVDGTAPAAFDTSRCVYGPDWHWAEFAGLFLCPTISAPTSFDLAPGPHTIVLTSREGQTVVDLFLLTYDPTFIPSS